MTCKETRRWLVASRPADEAPDEVREHLHRCGKCRRARRRLARLHESLVRLPAPPDTPAARERVMARVRADAPKKPRPPRSRPLPVKGRRFGSGWGRTLLAAAATLLLGVGIGWLLGRVGGSSDRKPVPGHEVAVSQQEVLARLLDRDLSLARSNDPVEQLQLLSQTGADLAGEAVRNARVGSVEQLPLLAGLYEQVVLRGVVGRASLVPAAQRQRVVPPVVAQLRETSVQVERLTASSLALAEWLAPVSQAARSAADALEGVQPAPALPERGMLAGSGSDSALLAVLVMQGVVVVEEDDPLHRADCCSQVAQQLSQGMMMASAQGDGARAATLGRYLGDYMDHAVKGCLSRVDGGQENQKLRMMAVVGRTTHVLNSLERNMEAPPVPGRMDMRRAMQEAQWQRFKELRPMLREQERRLRGPEGKWPPPKGPTFFEKGKGKGKGKG